MNDQKKNPMPQMMPVQAGMPVQFDVSKATQNLCSCGNGYFNKVYKLMTISAIMSPVGKELSVQVPVFICTECKRPLEIKPNKPS